MASYEISLVLYDRKGRQINGWIWRDSLEVKAYEETRSKDRFFIDQKSLFVNPGSYQAKVRLVDLNTNQSSRRKRWIEVPSFQGKGWTKSDLILAKEVSLSEVSCAFRRGRYCIAPNVGRTFDDRGPDLFLYFEMYGLLPGKIVEEVYQLKNRKGTVLASDSLGTEIRESQTSRSYRFSIENLEPGRYEVEVELKVPPNKRKRIKREFQMQWRDAAPSAEDYYTAVEQLRYIATPQEMKRLKESPPERRKELLKEFWKRRDPTPGTPRNELEEEYYRRVEYCNRQFGGLEGGWKSDRGKVYIIYGRPDEVERHPFETETLPYQIWYYLDKRLTFIFVDRHGFGDYELVTPLYPRHR